jgi:hypothetical protein
MKCHGLTAMRDHIVSAWLTEHFLFLVEHFLYLVGSNFSTPILYSPKKEMQDIYLYISQYVNTCSSHNLLPHLTHFAFIPPVWLNLFLSLFYEYLFLPFSFMFLLYLFLLFIVFPGQLPSKPYSLTLTENFDTTWKKIWKMVSFILNLVTVMCGGLLLSLYFLFS